MENSTATGTALQWTAASSVAGLLGQAEASDCYDCDFFDLFASLVYLFIFLYAMAKLILVSERYLGQHMLCCQNHINEVRAMSREWEQALQLCEADKGRLSVEVATLSEKNAQLRGELAELRNCNLHMIKVNLMRSVQLKQTFPVVPSNIYITNSHFHVTRHVFINEGHLCARNVAGGDVYSEEGISNVWMKYLKMRKCYMGPIADRCLKAAPLRDAPDPVVPVVMTTEQLAEMQGII